jgi:Flp pilus assembly protein TadG
MRGITTLLKDRRGGAALEFALVGVPFLALMVAILETGLVFFAQEVLQSSASRASRTIMTGRAQVQNTTATQFQQAVCALAAPLLSCANTYVNAQVFTSFANVTRLNPLQGGSVNPALMNFQTGGPGDIVMVQVFYQWPVVSGPLNFNLANMSGNSDLLVATVVFRNEPY